jgi:hypothetical protein
MSFGTPVEMGIDNEGRRNVNGQRGYRRQFYVLATATSDDEYGAVNATGIPAVGDAHPSDSGARMKEKTAKRESEDGRLKWIVNCEYSTSAATTAEPDDPTSRDPVITLSGRKVDWIPLGATTDGTTYETAIDNTADDAFDPPPVIQKTFTVITIQQNLSSFSMATKLTYEDTVNSDSKTVAGHAFTARQLYMEDITARTATENGTDYYDVTYTILCADINGANVGKSPDARATNTHDLVILNQGFFQVVSSVKFKCITPGDGTPATSPQLLAADGTQLAVGGDPVWLTFRARREQAWSGLSLPSTF